MATNNETPTHEDSRALLASLTGYTPGPLHAMKFCGEAFVYPHDLNKAVVASCSGLEASEAERRSQEEAYANARLYAAAPDLVDHLRAALDREAQLRADIARGAKEYCDLTDQRDAQHVQIEKLKAALRPFVVYVHDDLRRGKATYELVAVERAGGGLIGAEDLRRAHAALTQEPGA